MKILVTGGAGYLGSVMCPILTESGHEVTVIDDFMYSQASPVGEVIRGDVRDEKVMKKLVGNAEAIFPLACYTGAPLCDQKPKEAEEVNLGAVQLILKLRKPDQKIIFPTTNSGYGVGEKDKHCTEETPLRPISLYGRLKVQAEKEVLEAGNSITLRLATAFGVSPRMRLDLLVNDFTFKAVKERTIDIFEGHFKRNFIHVKDIAKAFGHGLNHFDEMKGQAYNVGLSDANISKLELAEAIKAQIPDFEIIESKDGKDPDKRDYIVSNEKIEKTGFKPDVSLSKGIAELIDFYDSLDLAKATYQLSNV